MKRQLKKLFKNIIITIIFLILIGLGNQSFGIVPKAPDHTNMEIYYIDIKIISNSLEWCVYLLFVAIFIFIVSLIWLIVLKIKKANNKTKKVLLWIFILSIICILITSSIFIINGIYLDDFLIFFGI